MSAQPTGTVTFLYADIEGSTRLLQKLGDRYPDLLTQYRALVRTAVREQNGYEVDSQGDSFLVAFARARDAVAAAVAAQRALATHSWPGRAAARVRMGLHTGEPVHAAGGYVGMDVHRVVRVGSAAHGGQILLSHATRYLVEPDLPEGVGLRDLGEHRLKDLQQPETLFQVLHGDLAAEFPPPRALDTLTNNLPVEVSSFIGRGREIGELKRLLAASRLITVTGTGGAGKTRLAFQVAAELLDAFPDGVWAVELGPLSDPGLVPHTVAAALGVREEPGQTVTESLLRFLRRKSLLLVLDNCEHLVSAGAHLVTALLRACPSVRIVATSREPLSIGGELTYRVPPLSLPEAERPVVAEEVMRCEAVRLFVERAVFVRPGFTLTEKNGPAVAQVCRRLDGIPLAIELAAARVKVLSVEQIAARLDDRFELLTGGTRTSVPRHQTLRAAIDWSYDLLSGNEQALLRRTAVFAGGFSLDAVERICAGPEISSSEVLDLLGQLVDKSLVLVETPEGEARYRLLDTVRRYARNKLLEEGEQTAFLTRHRDWCLALAEQAEPALQGPEQKTWLGRLELEHDNLREALAFSLEGTSAEQALRLAAALWWFWQVRGYLSEGQTWLQKALAAGSGVPSLARLRALYGAGFLAWRQGMFDTAQALGQESLALSRTLGNSLGIASAISLLEHVARSQGDYERAATLPEESLALFREMGDTWGIATTLVALGNAARFQGNYARARTALEESLELFRRQGDASGTAAALHFLGLVARDEGDYERAEAMSRDSLRLSRDQGDTSRVAFSLHSLGLVARDRGSHVEAEALFEESLLLFEEMEDMWGVTTALVSLGVAARLRGDGGRAAELLQKSLRLRQDLGDRPGIAECLEDLAGVAAHQRQPERAARLLGAAEALRAAIGVQLPAAHREDCTRTVATARKQLGKTAFHTAWAAGGRMTMEQAVKEALTSAPAPAATGRAPGRSPGTPPGRLTHREAEVAAMIAQGRSNREIARALVITEGTAANHVQHILNKLGLHSRAQIAAWAVERGVGQETR